MEQCPRDDSSIDARVRERQHFFGGLREKLNLNWLSYMLPARHLLELKRRIDTINVVNV